MWSADVELKSHYVVAPSKLLPTRHSNPVSDEEIVGFEIAAEKLIQFLTRGTSELDVLPIVGMGGQGKTTCARKLYNNDSIVSRFDVRAWCIISQTYNRRELLQDIFSQVTGSEDKGDKDDVLADMLRKHLIGKRYLIILDDMWHVNAWDDSRLFFPDVGNSSRIIITTRLENVGKQVKYHTDPYYLPFLTTKESCKLLQKKVFQKEDCPSELQHVSQAVAEKCKGLPLVVVLVSGIIKKGKMKESWWNEVKDALFDYLDHESEEYILSTMQLSYDNLPDCLKPCLLYMGMFPEDARIPVSKLISLWTAEGLVQNVESAEDYLMDLISSNVVMVSRRRYNGKVKIIQVHDVVLHFCLEKSREEKFMLAVKGHYNQFKPSEWKESRVSFSFSKELSKFASLGSKTGKPFHQCLSSLITTNKTNFDQGIPFPQISELRLLKVLDLSSCRVRVLFLAALKPLIHLKYLAIDTHKFYFHPELLLPQLETFILKVNYPVLPAIFWQMEKLRHVDISYAILDLENNRQQIFEESSKLENLRILREVVFLTNEVDMVDVLLKKCPNLLELGIFFSAFDRESIFREIEFPITESDGSHLQEKKRSSNFNFTLPKKTKSHLQELGESAICIKLESFTQLQSLRFASERYIAVSQLHLPSNLKKLVLRGFPVERIPFTAELSNLEYLQLWDYAGEYQRGEWGLGDITFHKLKFLKLSFLRFSRWNASDESFPMLETLVVKWCFKLKEIPLSFADIPTLRRIKLIGSYNNASLEDSAVKIKETVKDNEGRDLIDIIINKL